MRIRYGGAGRHEAALDSAIMARGLKLDAAFEFMTCVSIMCPKLAILCLYKRIFSTKPYQWAIYSLGGLVVLTCVACLLLRILICRPFAYTWDRSIPNGCCGDIYAAIRYAGIPNLLSDVGILLLPIHGVWRLRMTVIRKIGLSLTFLMGCM